MSIALSLLPTLYSLLAYAHFSVGGGGGGGIPQILWMFIGCVLLFSVVYFILVKAHAPGFAFTVFYVVAGLAVFLLICSVFFGGTP